MVWREAYLLQAKSDFEVFQLLNESGSPKCHQLHYLQMATEKLAKSYGCGPDNKPHKATHIVLVSFLRSLTSMPTVQALLGYKGKKEQFKAHVRSLLPVAVKVQNLSPSGGGFSKPNPEYPWLDTASVPIAPCHYDFPEFYGCEELGFYKFQQFIAKLIEIAPQT